MAVSLLAELALVWHPSWKFLCLGFHNKIVVVFQRTNHITAKSDFRTGQIVLDRMVNIGSGDRQTFYQRYAAGMFESTRSVFLYGILNKKDK